MQHNIAKKNEIKKMKEDCENIDISTGQALFHPKTGRPPKNSRKNNDVPVYLQLYNKKDDKE